MNIVEKVLETYPELTSRDFHPIEGIIGFQDDGDGIVYLCKWNYEKPLPPGIKLGK
jgi:hypothetical protein